MGKHDKCMEGSFNTSVEFVKVLAVAQSDEVVLLFRETCQNCGKMLGKEKQWFKHHSTESGD